MWVYRALTVTLVGEDETDFGRLERLDRLDPDMFSLLDEIPPAGWATEEEILFQCRSRDCILCNLPKRSILALLFRAMERKLVERRFVHRPSADDSDLDPESEPDKSKSKSKPKRKPKSEPDFDHEPKVEMLGPPEIKPKPAPLWPYSFDTNAKPT